MVTSVEAKVDDVIFLEDFPVGGAVVVVKDNQVLYGKGFGKSRLGVSGKAFTTDTIVSIQSISKSFAAAVLMQLVEKGLLELDKPLVQYLPYFKTTDQFMSNSITVKQLLSHTAGFPGDVWIGNLVSPNASEFNEFKSLKEHCGITDFTLQSINNREDVTKYFASVALSYPPGANWIYCTDAYIIAADLFEKVSGLQWDEFMENVFFKSLKLNRTTLYAEKVQQDEGSAQYYTSADTTLRNMIKSDANMDVYESPFPVNPLGAPLGFIYSTANDLGKYLSSYMSENPLMSQTMINRMHEPVWQINRESGYALGWGTRRTRNHTFIEHGGGFPGVSAYVCMVPSKRIGVVVVSNHDKTPSQTICYKVIDTLLERG
ncbi:beta-lactamase family protein [Paenibacillus pasadenensis]|uniref:serine hydrolase domain-containing protein n=1 Tax=Paenibacillus pasadenensis TaxID=217090 RepID=UPI00203CB0A4|nr:serine hydrolase domain-containing protein [Paenibacillus pasadenensis]MCM3749267.1 beta-lactamase family protein [Paenibacillus pasadenensis]